MRHKPDELTVITRAKELTQYVLTITEKSPKRFRFTLVVRMQDYCLDVIESLYTANSYALTRDSPPQNETRRREAQERAMTRLRLLAYISVLAREALCILPAQQKQIAEKTFETQKLLYAWVKSDEERLVRLRAQQDDAYNK